MDSSKAQSIVEAFKNMGRQAMPKTPIVPSSPPEIVHHDLESQATAAVQSAIDGAREDGRWMVAVWSVKDGRLKMRTRTTWNFPTADCALAVNMLRENIRGEHSLPVGEPLPKAELPEDFGFPETTEPAE